MTDASVDACIADIDTHLSKFEPILDRLTKLAPDFIAQSFTPESSVPTSATCLTDCAHTLGTAKYALHRYCVVGAEQRAAGADMGAVFFQRFYLDDVALRLYSAAEHLANAILAVLETTDADLVQIRNVGSQWERVRKYLNRDHPDLTITRAVGVLRRSVAWRFTMGYRGRWVHNQPPTIAGLGIVYHRKNRWEDLSGGGRRLIVGAGDAPEHVITDLADLFTKAFADFLAVLESVVDYVYEVLRGSGIVETPSGLSVRIGRR